MRHLVVGTAGHIDHGKSALVQALTGTDPDRLVEEKRRGITIELGFADMKLDDEHSLSFVDVPGHERFVRHMVAGATGIDAVVLVVAADQGIQPQTREHLEICSLLGLRRGMVALSKSDLVDPELREVVELELRELLQSTFLADAPIVAVSSRTGQGLDELRAELAGLFETVPSRPLDGVTRLPVDRSFVLRGFGTVVTGTLVAGRLEEGAEIEVLPAGERGRIRGLQAHHSGVATAVAGHRTAVNVQGLDCSQVPRGSTLTAPGALFPTRRILARVTLLEHAPRTLSRGGPVRFHQGTCERAARYRVLSRGEDETLNVELHLAEPTVLSPGDRFILRRPAPVDTAGGGIVMDVAPPHAREATADDFDMRSLEPPHALALRLRRAGPAGREPRELARELGVLPTQLEVQRCALEAEDRLVAAGPRWIDGDAWRSAETLALEGLERYHAENPLRLGMSRESLRAATCPAMAQESWRALLEQLEAQRKIRLEGETAARVGHEVVLAGDEREMADRIETGFREAGLEPPALDELVPSGRRDAATKIVDLLLARGRLVRVQQGKLFHAEALAELRARLRDYAKQSRTIDVAAFKQLAGVTRKNAIPLLEHLDAERTTRRSGNLREILDPT